MRLIGVIADTHGLVRPEALTALEKSDLIVHAGDIGNPKVLENLREIAPLVAVRGNVDKGEWAQALPKSELFDVKQTWFYVIHDVNSLDLDPVAAGVRAVISGHSHRPSIQNQRGVLLINPGSAGPRPIQSSRQCSRDRCKGQGNRAQNHNATGSHRVQKAPLGERAEPAPYLIRG